jgi:chorismate mutase
MEPMRPDFRRALKEAHPGLTDEVIDEYEKLTAMRYRLDQQKFRASVDEIDRKRDELLRARMPYFAQVAQAMVAQRKAERPGPESNFTVEIKPERPPEQGS